MIKAKKLEGLQVLRGIAASMVVFSHVWIVVNTYSRAPSFLLSHKFFFDWGNSGVDIFFVISGFIMYITTAGGSWSPNLAYEFIRKRVLRIYPLYWVYTTALLVIFLITLPSYRINLLYTISSYLLLPIPLKGYADTFFPILGQGWTLVYELYFYLVFALGIYFKRKHLFPLFLISVLLLLNIAARFFYSFNTVLCNMLSSPLILEFIWGVLLAIGYLRLKGDHSGMVLYKWIPVLGMSAGLLIQLYLLNLVTPGSRSGPIILGLSSACIVFSAVLIPEIRTAAGRFLVFLGNASYSIYLAHGFFAIAISSLLKRGYFKSLPPDLLILASTGIIILSCSLLHPLVEKPMMKLSRRLIHPSKNAGNAAIL